MIKQQTIQYLMNIVAVFLAYLMAIGPAGCFRAWVAKKMGDDTAEQQGLLTLDPLAHVDVFGVLSLAICGVGWGRNVAINPANIDGRFRTLKLICTFFCDILMHLALAFVGVLVLVGGRYLLAAHGYAAFLDTPTAAALSTVLAVFVQINGFLAVVSLIFNSFSLILIFINEQEEFEYTNYVYYAALFLPIFLMVFFGASLQNMFNFVLIKTYMVFIWLFGN